MCDHLCAPIHLLSFYVKGRLSLAILINRFDNMINLIKRSIVNYRFSHRFVMNQCSTNIKSCLITCRSCNFNLSLYVDPYEYISNSVGISLRSVTFVFFDWFSFSYSLYSWFVWCWMVLDATNWQTLQNNNMTNWILLFYSASNTTWARYMLGCDWCG